MVLEFWGLQFGTLCLTVLIVGYGFCLYLWCATCVTECCVCSAHWRCDFMVTLVVLFAFFCLTLVFYVLFCICKLLAWFYALRWKVACYVLDVVV